MIFLKHEDEKNKLLSVEKLYTEVLQIERNPACDYMIASMDLKNNNALDFGEWVDFVCKFCMYQVSDMLIFIFSTFEKDNRCNFDEFKAFCYAMVKF